MSGGVAHNSGVIRALSNALECEIRRPPEPDTVGALGAALIARDRWETAERRQRLDGMPEGGGMIWSR
jgi:activator of 2-hydroxyglutaryl-CoA dehydratase